MPALNFSDVENSLLHFRIGRQIILDRILEFMEASPEIREPALLLSRIFVRLKSADSIIEKIKRKKLPVETPEDIPKVIDDILGLRIIVENQTEIHAFERFLNSSFIVGKRSGNTNGTHNFGDKTIEYVLTFEKDGILYPCEVQLRTFLQHYWARHSFFLFNKADPSCALPFRDDLQALSKALQTAERLTESIQEPGEEKREESSLANWRDWPIRSRVYLMVIKPHEQFIEQHTIPITDNSTRNHHRIVTAKVSIYQEHPDATIVECVCADFPAFLFNEPQVHVGSDFIEKAIW